MEWLMIIAFIALSIMDSKKKSDKAKQQRAQRQQTSGGQVYRTGDGQKPNRQPQKQMQTEKAEGSFLGGLTEFLESLEDVLETEPEKRPATRPVPQTAKQTASKQTVPKQAPSAEKVRMQTVGKKKKAEPKSSKKSPAQLPTKTLMEQRPDREKREEHTKVSASVKPLKNAFENEEHCEHRIQLNPNIQYSKQQERTKQQSTVNIKTDGESIVQGIIWSEILGKPKAYQNRARRVGR